MTPSAVDTPVNMETASDPLSVAMPAPSAFSGAGAFAAATQEAFSELREVFVDSRMRLLSFHEDHRPAYFGTVSRKSAIISGRRPFAKDTYVNANAL